MAFEKLKSFFGIEKKREECTSSFYPSDGGFWHFSYSFDIRDFKKPSDQFDMSLARLSLAKSMASYNGERGYEKADEHISEFHEKLGFEHIESNQAYKCAPTFQSIGVQIGYRIIYQKLRKTLLISIAIRSGHYEKEWGSNFIFGEEGHHEGFLNAAKDAYSYFLSYFEKHDLGKFKRVKIWISGYSRGGAVSNLLAAKLTSICNQSEDEVFETAPFPFNKKAKVEIYAYTFEAPCPAMIMNQSADFDAIFNIYTPYDVVPFTPFPFLGFTRYGTSIQIYAQAKESAALKELLPSFERKPFAIREMAKLSFADSLKTYDEVSFIEEMQRFFEKDMGLTRQQYVEKYQFGLSHLAAFLKRGDAGKKAFKKISKFKMITALLSPTITTKIVKDLFNDANYYLPEGVVEEVGHSLWQLLNHVVKCDKKYRMMHLVTMLDSGASLFQNHFAEVIYIYCRQNEIEIDPNLLPLKRSSKD